MKLSDKERTAVAMMRLLDTRQREELLAGMELQVIANRVAMRLGKIRKLKIPADLKVVKAYGSAPAWKPSIGKR